MYADNQYKFVAVLNPKIEIAQLMNALGHITAGLIAETKNLEEMQFLKYEFQADWATSSVLSLYPFIVLKAKNSNQLKTLHHSASETGIAHNVFTDSMLGNSAIDQIEATKNTNPQDLIYFCVVLFGKSDRLATLTRKFSLFSV
jgi:hypothetical protein